MWRILLPAHLELLDFKVLLEHVLADVARVHGLLGDLDFINILVDALLRVRQLPLLLRTLSLIFHQRSLLLNIKYLVLGGDVPHARRERPQINHVHVVDQRLVYLLLLFRYDVLRVLSMRCMH